MSKILLIEDSKDFQLLICKTLSIVATQLTVASSYQEAMQCLTNEKFDLILLDVGLPDGDGFALCHEMQSLPRTVNTPFIFITGKNEPAEVVAGFSLGAEDFISKPFDPLILRARIEARLGKIKLAQSKEEILESDGLQVNLPKMKAFQSVHDNHKDLELTPTEFKLLFHLMRSSGTPLSRAQLVKLAWGETAEVSERTVDVHISSLRRKIGIQSRCIQVVSGVGYRFHSFETHQKAA